MAMTHVNQHQAGELPSPQFLSLDIWNTELRFLNALEGKPLSDVTLRILERSGIATVGHVCAQSAKYLTAINGLGPKKLQSLEELMASIGLTTEQVYNPQDQAHVCKKTDKPRTIYPVDSDLFSRSLRLMPEIPQRVRSGLLSIGIESFGQVLNLGTEDIMRLDNVGVATLVAFKSALRDFGIRSWGTKDCCKYVAAGRLKLQP